MGTIMYTLQLLTPREKEVLDLSVRGLDCRQIAFQLGISVNTVKKHRSRLIGKTGVSSMVELASRMTGEKK